MILPPTVGIERIKIQMRWVGVVFVSSLVCRPCLLQPYDRYSTSNSSWHFPFRAFSYSNYIFNFPTQCKYTIDFYVHVTVHRNKFLFNKTKRRTNFQIYFGIKRYMFRAASLPIVRSYLLYIRHWHILCRFDDHLLVGSGWNCRSFMHKMCQCRMYSR
jgi:hypothetical protein